jgi:ABC-2 type transport system ATP-binding protein
MIEAHDLVKRYGSTMAVSDLSFSIRPGLVTGFLGPNGAGNPVTELWHSSREVRLGLGPDRPGTSPAA